MPRFFLIQLNKYDRGHLSTIRIVFGLQNIKTWDAKIHYIYIYLKLAQNRDISSLSGNLQN